MGGVNWIAGIIVVFIFAAFLNEDIGPYLLLIVAFGFQILFFYAVYKGFVFLRSKINEKNSADEKDARIAAEIASRELKDQEVYDRLTKVFTPLTELYASLSKELVNWLKREAETTDKDAYREHLQSLLAEVEEGPLGTNSPFFELRQFQEDATPALKIGSYFLGPNEEVDKTTWDTETWFFLYEGEYDARENALSCKNIARFDLEAATEFIKRALAARLIKNHLPNAPEDLGLSTESELDLIGKWAYKEKPAHYYLTQTISM